MSTTFSRGDLPLHNPCVPYALRVSWVFVFSLLLLILSTSHSLALESDTAEPASTKTLDRQRLAAVMSIINMFLLSDDVTSLDLELNDFVDKSIPISSDFTVSFAQSSDDVELCFELSSSDITLSINGVEQTGANSPQAGENCYVIPAGQQQPENVISLLVPQGTIVRLSNVSLELASQTLLRMNVLTRSGWDQDAVRKVLRIFAFGGHATSSQIRVWADMSPKRAIREMLNFNQHNLKLSPIRATDPYKQTATQYGEFTDFVVNHLANPASNIPIDPVSREKYGLEGYAFDDSLQYMITTRGLNPFRHMVGFWETNYHLAVNLDSSVNNAEMAEFYDVIMAAHESRVPYQQVLAEAAKAAAVAAQYGHENNEWINGFCFCNDDFAREIHQLYFGIFGEGDEDHHENITIPNTANMLSGMKTFIKVPRPGRESDFPRVFDRDDVNYVVPDLSVHHVPPLEILRQTVSGAGPFEKIDALVEFSIEHPESLKNLPVMIISVIADDNLTENGKDQLRQSWASMGSNKQFLDFIQAYAISTLFHSESQRKYMSSFWRMYTFANKFNIDNIESYQSGRDGQAGRPINSILDRDEAQTFRPRHNVFGGQTSLEAADSASVFEENYNRATDDDYRWIVSTACDDCDQGQPWKKDWGAVIPRSAGVHKVDDVARWLWEHMVGNLDNYTPLERAHLVAILGASNDGNEDRHFDLPMFLCVYNDRIENGLSPNDVPTLRSRLTRECRRSSGEYSDNETRWLNKSYSVEELTNSLTEPFTGFNPAITGGQIPNLINQLGDINMPLLSDDDGLRLQANRRIHYAMAFISATPFMLVETGE